MTAPHELAATSMRPLGDHVTELTKRPGLSPSPPAAAAVDDCRPAAAPWLENAAVTASECLAIGAGIGRLVGEALRTLTTSVTGECPLSPAGGYAIVGAAAFSARRRGNLIPRDAIDAMSAQA